MIETDAAGGFSRSGTIELLPVSRLQCLMMYGMLQGQIMSNPLVARSSLWFRAAEWRSDHQIGRAKLDSKSMPVGVEDHQGLLF